MASTGVRLRPLDRLKAASSQILVPRFLFIFATIALVIFGLVMVYSASFVEAFTDPEIMDSSYFFKHQLELVGLGLVALVIASVVNYRIWDTWVAWIPWAIITVLLVLTLVFGNEELGGKRWYDLLGYSFQPSEFAKITVLLVSAMLLVKLHHGAQLKYVTVLAAVAIGLPIMLILLQPDLGTTLIALAGIIAIAWFGELPMKPLAIAILLVVFLGAGMVMLAGFRMARIDAWLDPWAYSADEGYQIVNSFYAFADGGFAGVGLGMSHQKYLYLPQPQNDLIFPIIGEEFGLIGTVSVVLLFLLFLYAAFRIARNAPDFYGRILAGSAAAMIGFQAFLNMLCMANLLPLTGKPLPFFSAGGSSIIVTLILVGLILNVSFRSSAPDVASKRRDELLILEGGRSKQKPGKPAILEGGWSKQKPGKTAVSMERYIDRELKLACDDKAFENVHRTSKAMGSGGLTKKTRYRKPGPLPKAKVAPKAAAKKAALRRMPKAPPKQAQKPKPLLRPRAVSSPRAPLRPGPAPRVKASLSPARNTQLRQAPARSGRALAGPAYAVNPALSLSPARNRTTSRAPATLRGMHR